LWINADSISVKILNYTIRNRKISSKMLGTILRMDGVWERKILVDNLLFILILNKFAEQGQHIFCITVFVICCRFHFCQHFELHYLESWDFEQKVQYGFTHR